MAANDKTVTILGAPVAVHRIVILPQVDGTFNVIVYGGTVDSNANMIELAPANVFFPAATPALGNLMPPALSKLLTANGLGS